MLILTIRTRKATSISLELFAYKDCFIVSLYSIVVVNVMRDEHRAFSEETLRNVRGKVAQVQQILRVLLVADQGKLRDKISSQLDFHCKLKWGLQIKSDRSDDEKSY